MRTLQESITEFALHMQKGEKETAIACRIYFEALTQDSKAAAAFAAAYEGYSKTTWDRLRAVGAGALDVAVLKCSDKMINKMLELSLKQQREILKTPVFNIAYARGQTQKPLNEFNDNDMSKVFTKDMHVRSIQHQRNWLAACARTNRDKTASVPYTIRVASIRVHRPVTLSVTELKAIVKTIEG